MLYLQYSYILILILVNIWVKILMAFQEWNGSFLKINDIYSYIAWQLWKKLISVPATPLPCLYYHRAIITISKDYLIAKIIS